MSERPGLHTALGAIGLLAWLLFILGCTGWPSWSPDGAKVLAPYFDPVAQQDGIALYNLKTHTARSIFVRPHSDNEFLAAQWESDGKRANVIGEGDSNLQVTLLPVGSGRPARNFLLTKDAGSLPPLPEMGGVFYVGGTNQISRLNLRTGEALSNPLSPVNPQTGKTVETKVEDEVRVSLHTDGSRLLYDRQKEAKDPLEVGTLDPGDLSLHPLFKVTKADLEARGVQGEAMGGFVAPEPRGSHIAVLVRSESEDSILLCSQSGLQTILKPDFSVKDARIGLPQWAPGGKTLYLPVAAEVEPGKGQYWVAEVPMDGGRVRMTKIARFKAGSDWADEVHLALQVSLSPDGFTLATTTAGLSENYIAPETKCALYLVNLRDPKRTVTSIPAPISRAPVRTEAAKTGKEEK